MSLKTKIKKVGAAAAGTLMVGATLAGAASLADYPSPFVKNGEVTSAQQIVVGSQGADPAGLASDIVGGIDVAAKLGNEAVKTETKTKTVSVEGSGEGFSISEGVAIEGTANDLNYGEALGSVDAKLKEDDLPELLAMGTVKDDGGDSSGTEYDYEQELVLGSHSVEFNTMDSEDYVVNTEEGENEIPILKIDQSSSKAYDFVVEFDDMDASDLSDSETINIAGKPFTFDPDMSADDTELVMFASESKEVVGVGDSATVTANDKEITMEVIGANTETDQATILVNGDQKQVSKGDTVTANDESLYINEIFMQTIPEKAAQVEFFVGSDEVTIDASGSTSDVEVDGEDLNGVEATVDATDNTVETINEIKFTFTPGDMDADEKEQLEIGEEIEDPLFGTFKTTFAGSVPALKSDSKQKISLDRSGSDLYLDFENREGHEYSFAVYEGDGTDVNLADDIYSLDTSGNYGTLAEDHIFILQEGTGTSSYVTNIFQVDDIDTDEDEVTVVDLATGKKSTVEASEQIGDTGAYVFDDTNSETNLDDTNFGLYNASSGGSLVPVENTVYTKNDMKVTLGAAANTLNVVFAEAQADNEDETTTETLTTIVSSDSDDDIKLGSLSVSGSNFRSYSDDDGNVNYGLTDFGTYTELEADDNGDYLHLWTPAEEADYKVFVGSVEGEVSESGGAGSSTVEYTETTASGVPDMAMLDSDEGISSAKSERNLILVGGPVVNALTGELAGQENSTVWGTETWRDGEHEDMAQIVLVDNAFTDGKVALVVAGHEAEDTRAAAKVLAGYDKEAYSGLFGENTTEITLTASEYTQAWSN